MTSDLEELVREGMRQVTETMRVSPDLAARTCERRRRRLRYKLTGLATATVVAVGTAGALIALAPASHQPRVQLAAWTVSKLADGNIKVTIRELKDPAGLQSTLRADGVPASVTFASQKDPMCGLYPQGTPGHPPHSTPLLHRVFPRPYQRPRGPVIRSGRARSTVAHGRSNRLSTSTNLALIVIHPAALPGNAGVQIATVYQGQRGAQGVDMPTVVYASPKCTGS